MPKIITLKIWGDEGLAVVDAYPETKNAYGLFAWVDEKGNGQMENIVLRPKTKKRPNPVWARDRDFNFTTNKTPNKKPRKHIYWKKDWFEYIPKLITEICVMALGEVPHVFKSEMIEAGETAQKKADTDFADKHNLF